MNLCDDCYFLKPKENEQTKNRELHMCHAHQKPVFHLGKHPNLPRPEWCNSCYRKSEAL